MASLKLTANFDSIFDITDSLISGISNPAPFLKDVAKYQKKQIEKQFDSEGANMTGRKWKPLAASTIRQRIRRGYGAGPILNASGRMKRSNKVLGSIRSTLKIGNLTSYFKYHQSAKSDKRRTVYKHSPKMVRHVEGLFNTYIEKIT